jgi:hypothetical protein
VNIFAGGRSDVKILLFAFYTALLLGITLVSRTKYQSGRIILIWIASLSTVLYGAGLLNFLYFNCSYGIGWKNFAVIFNNGEISSNMLFHNHVFKGSLGLLLNVFHKGVQENTDTGLAFMHLLPSSVYGGVLVCMFAILVLFVWYFVTARPTFLASKSYLFSLAYAIFTFSLMKNVFDGGLLNKETPVAAAGLMLLIFYDKAWARWVSGGIILFYVASCFVAWRIGALTSAQFFYFIRYLFVYTVLAGEFIFWLHSQMDLSKKLFFLAVGMAVISGSVYWEVKLIHREGNIQIQDSNPAIIGLNENISDPDFTLNQMMGNYHLYTYSPSNSVSVSAIWKRFKLLDNLEPVLVKGKSCPAVSTTDKISFIMISPQNLSEGERAVSPGSMAALLSVQNLGSSRHSWEQSWNQYRVTLLVDSCAPRVLNIIEGLMKDQGITTFIIVNPVAAQSGINEID